MARRWSFSSDVAASPSRSPARAGRLHSGRGLHSGGKRLHGHANNCPTVTIPHPSAAKGHPLSPRAIASSPVTTRPCRRFSFGFPASRSSVLGSFQQVRQLCDVGGDPARFIALRIGFGIRTAPSKVDKSNPMVRTILMHGVAPQCAVKVAVHR